jgi:predicted metal-dependent phosphoesterase TrpH
MKKKAGMITAEFHCHTVYSMDSSNRVLPLIEAARSRGIDRLAVTDHNTICGALIAKENAPDLIIIGEEILTSKGELLAYYLTEEIPPGLSPMQTIEEIRKQGGFITVPHPMDKLRYGWQIEDLIEILPYVDALETFNARCLHPRFNREAAALADEWSFPQIAGSDAHSLVELGLATMRLPMFANAEEMLAAVREGEFEGRLLSPLDHYKASLAIGLGRLNPFKK